MYDDEVIDIRDKYGDVYLVSVEDPFFVATQCPWHYIIVGKRGSISPSGPQSLYVSYGPDGSPGDHSFHVSEFDRYRKAIKAIRR